MEQSITSVVDGQVVDFRAPPIAYAANAREHVVSDDLIEYLPIEPQVLGRLHVDQHVINHKVCIGTSHEFGRGAERRIEDAALLRPEKARPDESEHALKIINQCFPGAFENTRIDNASAEDYIQVSKIDRRLDQISWWSALRRTQELTMALFRLLEQRCGLFAGCGVGRCAQVVESRFGYPCTCFCGRIELLNVKPQQVIEVGTGANGP
jgi:hypothetical protein